MEFHNAYKYIFVVFFLSLFVACDDKLEKEISQISVETKIIRFDSLFFESNHKDFVSLPNQFPYLFPKQVPDSVWINKRNDTLQRELYHEVKNIFSDFSTEKKILHSIFQHVKYYFPKFNAPKIITLTSDVDYNSRVIYADSLLLIGVDNYLSSNHKFYSGIQEYIRFSFDKKYLPIDVAMSISETIVQRERHINFLETMIYEGKKLYLAQKFLPKTSEEILLKYSKEKYNWAVANEAEIWRYFIQNQLLYDTDKKTLNRFIDPAPFSKFYMDLDSQSPGAIGRFIGFQIVKSYMNKNPQELTKMLITNSDELFKKAYYKPNK